MVTQSRVYEAVGAVFLVQNAPRPSGRAEDRVASVPVAPPGVITLDNRAFPVTKGLPTLDGNRTLFLIEAETDGDYIDISEFVLAASWRYGTRFPNRVGGAAEPGSGVLMLSDNEGRFSPYNPAQNFDPRPGRRFVIIRSVQTPSFRTIEILFSGYSDGMRMTASPVDGSVVQILPVISVLGRIVHYGGGVLLRATSDRNLPGQLISDLLTEAGWTGARDIPDSSLRLLTSRLNYSGVTRGSWNKRAELMPAIATIATLDGGYFYDTPISVVYEPGDNRRRRVFRFAPQNDFAEPRRTHTLRSSQIHEFKSLAMDSAVVNVIEGRNDSFTSMGDGRIIPLNEQHSAAYEIPPGVYSLRFTVRTDSNLDDSERDGRAITFVESWNALIRGAHFNWLTAPRSQNGVTIEPSSTTPVPEPPSIYGEEADVDLRFDNRTGRSQWFELIALTGEPFRRAWSARIAERNSESVALYGEKSIEYQMEFVADPAQALARVFDWLDIHSGLPSPILHAEITIRDPELVNPIETGDLLYVDLSTRLPGIDKDHFSGWAFWVEAVEWTYDSTGALDLKIKAASGYTGEARRILPTPDPTPVIPPPPPNPLNWRQVGFVSVPEPPGEAPTPVWEQVGFVTIQEIIAPIWVEVGKVERTDAPEAVWNVVGRVYVPTTPAPPSDPVWRLVGFVIVPRPIAPAVPVWRHVGFVSVRRDWRHVGFVTVPRGPLWRHVGFVSVPSTTPAWRHVGFVIVPR